MTELDEKKLITTHGKVSLVPTHWEWETTIDTAVGEVQAFGSLHKFDNDYMSRLLKIKYEDEKKGKVVESKVTDALGKRFDCRQCDRPAAIEGTLSALRIHAAEQPRA